jgi:hypothetical protein
LTTEKTSSAFDKFFLWKKTYVKDQRKWIQSQIEK